MPSGTEVSIPASGSWKPVPNAQRASLSEVIASSALSNAISASYVRDVLGDLVERRVAVDLVAARREERVLLVRARRGDAAGLHHPDADALVAPGVQVPGVAQRHLGVGGSQGADVHVVQATLAPHEDLVQRPVAPDAIGLDLVRYDRALLVLRHGIAHAASSSRAARLAA